MTDPQVQPQMSTSVPSDSSIADTLRRTRESQGLSIAEVANYLKLNPRQIEALESGRFDVLPGAAFTRGFLRNYARLLKIDPEPLLAGLQSPARSETVELSPASNAHGDMPQVGRGRFRRSVIPGMIAALALFGLVVAGWYYDTQRKKPTEDLVAETAQAQADSQAAAAEAAAVPPAAGADAVARPDAAPASQGTEVSPTPVVVPAESHPAPAQPAAPTAPEAVAPAATGNDKLVFEFAEDAWVEVKDKSGKAIFSKLGKAGSRQEIEAAAPLSVVVGNARAVKLERNGKAVDFGLTGKATIARLKFE